MRTSDYTYVLDRSLGAVVTDSYGDGDRLCLWWKTVGVLFASTTNKTTATHIIVNGQYCPAVNGHVMGRQTQQWTVYRRPKVHCNSCGCGCED